MKCLRILYFASCFSVICIFFYLFCNSYKNKDNKLTSSWTQERRTLLPSLISYFKSTEQYSYIQQCNNITTLSSIIMSFDNVLWQEAINRRLYLYSAFIDQRLADKGKIFIRILGMSKGVNTESLYCQLRYINNTIFVSKAQQEEIWIANWDAAESSLYYRPYIFSCPVEKSKEEALPISVSVSQRPCQKPNNLFPLKQPHSMKNKRDFVVCLKSLNFENDISFRLLEWIELQLLLGSDRISIYIHTIHPNITKVLDYYNKLGKVYIKYYKSPNEEESDSEKLKISPNYLWQKRRHEIIQYNDCLYDHINTHKFVVNLDLDEAIIPIFHLSWTELLHQVFVDHTNALLQYASLSATNVYFFDKFGVDDDNGNIPPYMHMLQHVYRSANFSGPGFAVKSFHSTNTTFAVFNHYTLFPLYPELHRNALIGRHLAQMHHYRATCPPLMEKECQTNFMKFHQKDTVIWKFKDILIQNVKRVAQELDLIKIH